MSSPDLFAGSLPAALHETPCQGELDTAVAPPQRDRTRVQRPESPDGRPRQAFRASGAIGADHVRRDAAIKVESAGKAEVERPGATEGSASDAGKEACSIEDVISMDALTDVEAQDICDLPVEQPTVTADEPVPPDAGAPAAGALSGGVLEHSQRIPKKLPPIVAVREDPGGGDQCSVKPIPTHSPDAESGSAPYTDPPTVAACLAEPIVKLKGMLGHGSIALDETLFSLESIAESHGKQQINVLLQNADAQGWALPLPGYAKMSIAAYVAYQRDSLSGQLSPHVTEKELRNDIRRRNYLASMESGEGRGKCGKHGRNGTTAKTGKTGRAGRLGKRRGGPGITAADEFRDASAKGGRQASRESGIRAASGPDAGGQGRGGARRSSAGRTVDVPRRPRTASMARGKVARQHAAGTLAVPSKKRKSADRVCSPALLCWPSASTSKLVAVNGALADGRHGKSLRTLKRVVARLEVSLAMNGSAAGMHQTVEDLNFVKAMPNGVADCETVLYSIGRSFVVAVYAKICGGAPRLLCMGPFDSSHAAADRLSLLSADILRQAAARIDACCEGPSAAEIQEGGAPRAAPRRPQNPSGGSGTCAHEGCLSLKAFLEGDMAVLRDHREGGKKRCGPRLASDAPGASSASCRCDATAPEFIATDVEETKSPQDSRLRPTHKVQCSGSSERRRRRDFVRIGGKGSSSCRTGSSARSKSRLVLFGSNVDIGTWHEHLAELRKKLPPWLLWQGRHDLLSFLRQDVEGMNTPQMYMKVGGAWTGGHEENNRFRSVNMNHGPAACEWWAVHGDYSERVRHLVLSEYGVDIYSVEGQWMPSEAWFIQHEIPVMRTLQEAGDLITLQGCTLHWVRAVGPCVCSSWNYSVFGVSDVDSALARYELNSTLRPPMQNMVPMKTLFADFAAWCVKLAKDGRSEVPHAAAAGAKGRGLHGATPAELLGVAGQVHVDLAAAEYAPSDAWPHLKLLVRVVPESLLRVCSAQLGAALEDVRRDYEQIDRLGFELEKEPPGAAVLHCEGSNCNSELFQYFFLCEDCLSHQGCASKTPYNAPGRADAKASGRALQTSKPRNAIESREMNRYTPHIAYTCKLCLFRHQDGPDGHARRGHKFVAMEKKPLEELAALREDLDSILRCYVRPVASCSPGRC